jgi:PadR family transcriptional regulator PadR
LLVSVWREENKRNKRFYKLSSDGQETLACLLAEWQALNTALGSIVSGSQELVEIRANTGGAGE